MRQDPGKVPGKTPAAPPDLLWAHRAISRIRLTAEPLRGKAWHFLFKESKASQYSHLLLAEVQFRVGSEGPGRVSTGASLPWPRCLGLGAAYGEVPSGGPRCNVDRSRGRDSQAPALGLSRLLRACRVQIGVSEVDSDSGCCLDCWAECGLLGVSGPTPSGRSGSPVPAPRAPGSAPGTCMWDSPGEVNQGLGLCFGFFPITANSDFTISTSFIVL